MTLTSQTAAALPQASQVNVAALAYTAPRPIEEAERLEALKALHILDTAPDDRFDRIVRLAKSHLKTPVVRISFVDDDRTWFKACIGMNVSQAPRDISICSHTILRAAPLVIPDLAEHPLFQTSPQVTGRPHFRFYAGAPVTTSDGFRVGSICLMDFEPHPEFNDDDSAFLSDLANIVSHELELHQQIEETRLDLARANTEAARAKSAKKRFLAIVSHELRTPLNAIAGFSDLTQKALKTERPDCSEYLAYVTEAATHLQRQVDRIITYSDAQSPTLELEESEFPLKPVLTRCVAAAALGDGNTVQYEEDYTSAPFGLLADRVHISQIVTELVENAAAFSKPNSAVRIFAKQSDDGGLRLSFQNNGDPIAEHALTATMDPFAQADDSLARIHNGLGLGLSIARTLARLHGGDVALRNVDGVGVETELTLPASRSLATVHGH